MILGRVLVCTVSDVVYCTCLSANCEDLEVALNYGQAMGSPQLLRFVTEHTEVRLVGPLADSYS